MVETFTKIPNTICAQCQTPIYRRPNHIRKAKKGVFCNKICYGKSKQILKACVVCGKPILSKNSKQTCSEECKKANYLRPGRRHSLGKQKIENKNYRKTTTRSFRKFYFLRHEQKCQICGYDKHVEILNIHHIIERSKGGNDEDKNLIILCPNCHAEVHKGFQQIESCQSR